MPSPCAASELEAAASDAYVKMKRSAGLEGKKLRTRGIFPKPTAYIFIENTHCKNW